jgi:predicted nucleotidyltransferase
MDNNLSISLLHLTIVKEILKAYLPSNAKVWVFGSRATNKVNRNSDLDLAIDKPLKLQLLYGLEYAFEESDLPYSVDIVDVNTTSTTFLEVIKNSMIELVVV